MLLPHQFWWNEHCFCVDSSAFPFWYCTGNMVESNFKDQQQIILIKFLFFYLNKPQNFGLWHRQTNENVALFLETGLLDAFRKQTPAQTETGSRLTVKFMATRGSAECLTNKHINENSWWNLTCRLAFHNKDTQKERKKDWMGERQKERKIRRAKGKETLKCEKKEADQSAVRWHRKHQQISVTIVMVTLHFTAKLQHTLTHTNAHRHLEFKCKCSGEAALSRCT